MLSEIGEFISNPFVEEIGTPIKVPAPPGALTRDWGRSVSGDRSGISSSGGFLT